MNINDEIDLPGQVKKYCNDDVRYIDTGTEKALRNERSYMNQLLIIDTEAVYYYDDRTGEVNIVTSLDDIQTVGDILELRDKLLGILTD